MRRLPFVPLVLATAVVCALGPMSVQASDKEELLEIRNTILNLVDALVEQGILTEEKAEALKREAAEKARTQAREAALAAAPVEDLPEEEGQQVIRVPYVPEFILEDMRAQVRTELRSDVVEDVMAQARTERWGMPDALPDWVDTFKLSGDIRLRAQRDSFADDNAPPFLLGSYVDFNEVNDAGAVDFFDQDTYLNTTEDRTRGRARLRLNVDARVNNSLRAGVRLSTGNLRDPVSTNQTLGNTGNRYQVVLDRAYLKYDGVNLDNYNWLTLQGGRIPNPWFSTDLVWDSDLGFEGVAATFRRNLSSGDSLFAMQERDRTLYFTLGAFPLQEVELSSDDKWLVGAQIGTDMVFDDQSSFKWDLAYYNYINIEGEQYVPGSPSFPEPATSCQTDGSLDHTAPEFVQKGNTMRPLVPGVGRFCEFEGPWGLATDYDLINLTARYTFAQLAPIHVTLQGDYVRNIGGRESEVEDPHPLNAVAQDAEAGFEGYQVKLTAGWPVVSKRRDWQVFLAYKHLERDAVLDAFTDSDFHLGGTDGRGWMLGGRYGLDEDTWLQLRWLTSDEIDRAPLAVDTWQLDLNAAF